jgi:mRNA-degrading endonuclease RelE of RelBE toxin-antitoxin system
LSKVQFRKSAEREFDRLSGVQQKAIYDKLKSIDNGDHFNKNLFPIPKAKTPDF